MCPNSNPAVAKPRPPRRCRTGPNSGKFQSRSFEFLNGAQPFTIPQRCPGNQERIEQRRRERDRSQPSKMSDNECENHEIASANRLTFLITRKCTARKISCVHQSKYQLGRTCSVYH